MTYGEYLQACAEAERAHRLLREAVFDAVWFREGPNAWGARRDGGPPDPDETRRVLDDAFAIADRVHPLPVWVGAE